MEIHQIRYFVEVARCKHFTRASEHCNVSQPTLSQQIKKLEKTLGEPLFHRLKKEVRLTDFGERFYLHATAILNEMNAAMDDAQAEKKLLQGRIRLGVIPTIAPYMMPGLIKAFTSAHPNVELEITENTTAHLLQGIIDTHIDMALLSLNVGGDHWESISLGKDELLVTLPPKHPLGKRKNLPLRSVGQEPFILMQESHCLGKESINFCNRAKFKPNVIFKSAQVETVQALISSGMGISLLPTMAKSRYPHLRYLHVSPKPIHRNIGILWRRGAILSRSSEALIKIMRNQPLSSLL